MPDNYQIADHFSLLSKLMDIHGENSFKSKSYSIAAFNIEKLATQLSEMSKENIASIKGIGEAIGLKIVGILQTGKLALLEDYIQKTPPGILEMLQIKGLGPKKIATIWKEMEIESIGELLYACNENRLSRFKGFGEKTQLNVRDSIEFFLKNQGNYLYAELGVYAKQVDQTLKKQLPAAQFELTGGFRRQMETLNSLDWVTTADKQSLQSELEKNNFATVEFSEDLLSVKGPENIQLNFYFAGKEHFGSRLFETSASSSFLEAWKKNYGEISATADESAIFSKQKLSVIPACLRETAGILEMAAASQLPTLIQPEDIRGIIHSHSTWSDGAHSLEDMAKAAKDRGLEYLVISDHSKVAFYANGLNEERVKAQHEEINLLNEKLKPFKIFKSIEADILNDGSLDYGDPFLSCFDLVIASVHSNLKMTEEKAMTRLLNAIKNPHTTILGHMTGRLLLSRAGYPVNYEKIIEACKEHGVVIEHNAHPRRLDIDWRWIEAALNAGLLISIDPDAHSIEGFDDTRYGVLSAQKGGLTKEKNLSSFSLKEFEDHLAKRKKR